MVIIIPHFYITRHTNSNTNPILLFKLKKGYGVPNHLILRFFPKNYLNTVSNPYQLIKK